jgi:hypothetical protein
VFLCLLVKTILVSGLLIIKSYQAVYERKSELIVSAA